MIKPVVLTWKETATGPPLRADINPLSLLETDACPVTDPFRPLAILRGGKLSDKVNLKLS